MYRVDHITASTTLLPPSAPTGNPGAFFIGGDPIAGGLATVVEAEWLNMQQEELCNVVIAGGLALNKADRTQLTQAIRNIAANAGAGFVLRAGDTMTGDLIVNTAIHSYGGRFHSTSPEPSVYVHIPGSFAGGMWIDGGGLYLGQTDGAGNPGFRYLTMLQNGTVIAGNDLSATGSVFANSGQMFVSDTTGSGTGILWLGPTGLTSQITGYSGIMEFSVTGGAAPGARLTTDGFQVYGPGIMYPQVQGAEVHWMAFGYTVGSGALNCYVDSSYAGALLPTVFASDPNAARSIAVDALAAIEATSLGSFSIDMPDGSQRNVPIGFMSADDLEHAGSPFLVRAIQQLAERLQALETAGRS
jgi:hypothetical protein